MTLVLQAVEVRGPGRWRWLLTDGQTGVPLADHQVMLDPDAPQLRAFGDVYGYAREYAAPDQRALAEARLVAELGAWAGRELLGERIGAAIVNAAPVMVRVTANFAVGWPLELAHVAGMPLASRGDVSLVYAAAGIRPWRRRRSLRRCGCWLCSPSRPGPACWPCGGSGTSWGC